ncbi:MAG: anthranilate phosphoribosyltransferase [Dehalococcoidia bacterium]|nr:anthranilate phosphoribosyltransferase [Dehalococcoidia bacterium]MDD5493823.1 anthranilate phosphoribosyltransferase [Dehalococcoidia bacterium]
MIKEAIVNLVSGNSLTLEEASTVMEEIMEGNATQAQLGAFLVALRLKGETAEEVAGLASVMRAKSRRVTVSGPVVDVVGTGGDGSNTFNISTTAAFIVAGSGLKVAKHGNRAMSSRCGSADVLEALGVKIELSADQVKQCIEEVGIGFMFAQAFHPAMKHAAAPRKEIGIRTVFNILGPLTNPAGAQYIVIGVPSEELGDKISLALCHLEVRHAMVVHGLNGFDELSVSGKSAIWEVRDSEVVKSRHYIQPEDFGIKSATDKDMLGGTPAENAAILRSVLSGEKSPRRDVALLNAAAGLYVGGRADSLKQAVKLAGEIIDSGRARARLEQLASYSSSLQ